MTKVIHPQLQQLLNLLLLLILGKYGALMYLSWLEIFYVMFGALCIEACIILWKKNRLTFFPYSALTTSIGVMFMMVSTHYYLYFILIFFALFQKHFIRYHGQHFFNPSNFALIMGLLFFTMIHIWYWDNWEIVLLWLYL